MSLTYILRESLEEKKENHDPIRIMLEKENMPLW